MEPNFIDNKNIIDNIDNYLSVTVCPKKIIESWKASLFSYEWLLPDGRIKDLKELSAKEQPKREHAEKLLTEEQDIEKPVLGIGLLENIEIGIGRDIFLTLAANNIKTIQVHIPKSHSNDFQKFLL